MEDSDQPAKRSVLRQSLVACGFLCTVSGGLLLLGAAIDLVPVSAFQLGGESGYRVIGAIAVLGCMVAALGYLDD
jgi:hypothetical protein